MTKYMPLFRGTLPSMILRISVLCSHACGSNLYLRTQQKMRSCWGTYCVFSIRGESLSIQVRKARRRRVLSSTCWPSHIRSMEGVFHSTGRAMTMSKEGRALLRLTDHSLTGMSNDLGEAGWPSPGEKECASFIKPMLTNSYQSHMIL